MEAPGRKLFLLPDVISAMPVVYGDLMRESSCWRMNGRICIGLVFVESSVAGGPQFTATERLNILNEIMDGLRWLAAEHPRHHLTWIYHIRLARIDVANRANRSSASSGYDAYWRNPATGKVSFNGHTYAASDTGITNYREDLRTYYGADHATTIFVTSYGTSWHAYSTGKQFISLSEHGNDWGGWGITNINNITVHEMCHKFGAADEYSGSGTPCSSCTTTHGCDHVPNGNCESCAVPGAPCAMRSNVLELCSYTRGQIGWTDLLVSRIQLKVTTANVANAGTDDDVRLTLAGHTWNLDNRGDDFERGDTNTFNLPPPAGMHVSDLRSITISKSRDGIFGGWKLKGLQLIVNDIVIYNNESINRWLEDDHRIFTDTI